MPDTLQLSDFHIGDIITADGLGDTLYGIVYHIGRLDDSLIISTEDALWAIWDSTIDALIEKSSKLDGKKVHCGQDHFAYADTEKMWYISLSTHTNRDPVRILGHIEVTRDVRVDRFEHILSSDSYRL